MSGMGQPPLYAKLDRNPASSNTSDDKSRPGKFNDLEGFVKNRGPPDYKEYREVHSVNPEPGAIIHIIDGTDRTKTQSRLHQRIMLVVRHEDPISMTTRAMTCVPLCFHNGHLSQSDHQHWNVRQELDPISKANNHYSDKSPAVPTSDRALAVKLKPGLFLQGGLTVNLAELWHVEYDHIRIHQLGRASSKSRALAFKRILELLTRSLDPYLNSSAESKKKKQVAAI